MGGHPNRGKRKPANKGYARRLGICCGPKSVEGSSLNERALKLQDVLREAGADYFEMAWPP